MWPCHRMFGQALVLGAFFITSCAASFSSGELPTVTYEQIIPHDTKPSISYEEFFAEIGANNLQAESRGRRGTMFDIFHEEIEYVLNKSMLFSEVNAKKQTGEYNFSFILRRQGEYDNYSEKETASSLLPGYAQYFTMITLGIIPSCSEVAKYHLTVEVKKADQTFKKYEYKQDMIRWTQFPFFLPIASSHKSDQVQKKIIDDMLLVFLRDFENDRMQVMK